jgi:hypothetical protein
MKTTALKLPSNHLQQKLLKYVSTIKLSEAYSTLWVKWKSFIKSMFWVNLA